MGKKVKKIETMKKTIICLTLTILLCIAVSASLEKLGTFKKGDSIELLQICATCTFINITSITAPNSTTILSGVSMDKEGAKFNYTLQSQESIGTYNVCGVGDIDGDNTAWCYTFDITAAGYKPTTAQSIIYFILLFISLICFILAIFISFNIDTEKYKRDTISGKVIAINWKRYYRIFCWGIAYGLFVWICHLARSIAEVFLESSFIAAFFKMLFYIMLSLMWPLMALLFYMLVASWIMDIKNRRLINRGLKPR